MRKFTPTEVSAEKEWQVVYQIVVLCKYGREVLNLAHQNPFNSHFGINKTLLKSCKVFIGLGLGGKLDNFVKLVKYIRW